MPEQTLLLLKPDAIKRGLKEEILKRVTDAGLVIIKERELQMDPEVAARLYKVHNGKSFYEGLLRFITSGPVFVAIVDGEAAILRLREIMGPTDPRQAGEGTIRGDLKEENIFTDDGIIKNLVHGSDSKESFDYETPIFF